MPRSFRKDPQARKDYEFDWSGWLTEGDSISSHTVTAATGLTLDSSSATSTAVTVWLSGGVAGMAYPVTCHIVTAAGREDDRTLTITVGEM
jgi:hypothetical protein